MVPEVGIRVRYEMVLRPGRSALSLTAPTTAKKELLAEAPAPRERVPPQGHYDLFRVRPRMPFAVAGARNVLSNLRCIGYSPDLCARMNLPPGTLAAVAEEHDRPGRPYHVFRHVRGQFVIEEFTPTGSLRDPQPGLGEAEWLVSGTPVLWDCDPGELFERMVTDAADHSHVWRLPRGRSPAATDTSCAQWQALQDVFLATLTADRPQAAAELTRLAERFGLEREDNYLHSVWGVGPDNELIIIVAHGRLEEVGKLAQSRGARRAVCVENSGSCGFYIVTQDADWVPLVRAPNFRSAGTAFAFFDLPDSRYGVLPES